jgi:hypothetical protein
MTTIQLTIDGDDVRLSCDSNLATPEKERKYAAIVLAALDRVWASLEANSKGDDPDEAADYIAPTIDARLREAGITSPKIEAARSSLNS